MRNRNHESAEEELMRRDRKRQKAKTKLAELKQSEADHLLIYTGVGHPDYRQPYELQGIRAWWWRVFCWAAETPKHINLMALCMRELYNVEGVMSKWLNLPEILDDDAEGNYNALISHYKDNDIDYSEFVGDVENAEEEVEN